MQPEASGLTGIQASLQAIIESAQQSWTYTIFWLVSHSGQGSYLDFGDGYYKGEEDEGKETNSSSSSPIPIAERDYRIKVLSDLNSLIMGQQDFADDAEITEVTDREWFFLLSMTQSFAEGSGLPGQAWQSSRSVWITGRKNLANYSCDRARQAQIYGLRTLVFIPSEIGVIELGSTALNFQRMDLVNKTEQLLNSICGLTMFQPGDESVSSNSIGNCGIVRSKTDLSEEEEEEEDELSLGLHLGFKAWPAKPKNESKPSSSSVGNYPMPVVKDKRKPQFSGKLQMGSNNHSDSTDINAFVHILRRRR